MSSRRLVVNPLRSQRKARHSRSQSLMSWRRRMFSVICVNIAVIGRGFEATWGSTSAGTRVRSPFLVRYAMQRLRHDINLPHIASDMLIRICAEIVTGARIVIWDFSVHEHSIIIGPSMRRWRNTSAICAINPMHRLLDSHSTSVGIALETSV